METIHINAEKKAVGRIATDAALLLQGKRNAAFRPHRAGETAVIITHTDHAMFTGKKLDKKIYYRHTGYIGHLKQQSLRALFRRDSREVIRRAIRGMLPKNRLLQPRMRRLTLYRGNAENSSAAA